MMLAWWGTWLSLTFVFISSLILGLWLGPWWAWALGLAALLAMAGWQMWFVSRLLKWLKGPMDARVPRAWGVWDMVFAGLHRRVRVRMEQQQMLQEALERLRRAGEALPDGVITFNRFRQIDGINARAALHFGLNPMVDKGQPLTNLIRQPEFVAYLEAGYYDEPLTLHNDRVPGQTLQVQLVPYGEGQTLLLSRDISQLEKLETMRRDFVANVSHELKTPLTVVNGFVEMLVDDYGAHSPEEAVHYLRLVQDQATRMQHLIEDLLTLSALETGGSAPTEERVAVAPLLEAILAETQALSGGSHEITLDCHGPAILLGNGPELRSAFGNLAFNAVRYTPAGGRVEISWQSDSNGGGVYSVTDTGIGIAPQHLPRLTERFYRVDRSRSRETGGTGLGLAIVKHVLTRHQARLEITSEPGKGSRFSVRFLPSRVAEE